MSDELFEVAFSGQIAEGADIEQVKTKVAAIFKADAGKLAQLFSGKRVVIKKNIDQAMANRYKSALQNAGAVCEVKSLSAEPVKKAAEVVDKPEVIAATAVPATPVSAPVSTSVSTPISTSMATGDIPSAPQTAPLGINADDISELSASLAPPGSDVQDAHEPLAAAEIDVSGLDVAPVGSDLGQTSKDDEPPPPDSSGLSMVE
ncbi:MAG TPA: hypothetical protein ENJ08_02925 [Gammaproteobacteria bacterium]|nr:hypothetical protein [Gammaproteobacteria bacterium]